MVSLQKLFFRSIVSSLTHFPPLVGVFPLRRSLLGLGPTNFFDSTRLEPLTLSLWPWTRNPRHENARSHSVQRSQLLRHSTQLRQCPRTQIITLPRPEKPSANKNDWKEQERPEVTAIPLCLRWQDWSERRVGGLSTEVSLFTFTQFRQCPRTQFTTH